MSVLSMSEIRKRFQKKYALPYVLKQRICLIK